jgi:YVTN family beta-propeller protein
MKALLRWVAGLCALASAGTVCADTLLVVRKSGNAVEFVEPGTGSRLMSVEVGPAPHEIAVSPDGRRAIVTNYGTAAQPGNTVSLLDLEQPREIARIDLGRHTRPHGISWYAPDRVAITTEGSGDLLLLDPAAKQVIAAIATGQSVSHMVVVTRDGARAFVSNIESGTTTAIDLATGRKLRDLDTGAGSEAIAIAPDDSRVWVAARDAGQLSVIDAASLEIVKRVPLAGVPIRVALTSDGRTALVSCAGSGEVVAIDAQSLAIVARRHLEIPDTALAAGGAAAKSGAAVPLALSIAADDRSAYVAATAVDTVVRLALPGLAVAQTIAVPGEPDGLGRTALLPKFECHACEPEAE